jgi:hypothetical protein
MANAMIRSFTRPCWKAVVVVTLLGCSRSGLGIPDGESTTSAGGSGGGGGPPCIDGEVVPCGTDVGACELGEKTCHDGAFGPCIGDIGPVEELCNDVDDDCDGPTDEDFGLGGACDGSDSDLCADDIMTCAGCTVGPDTLEVCNGFDDNCNGIIDSDCEVGNCQPTLIVTGSTPSDPGCIDFPVEAGSTGTIEYPCGGGPVTAQLGSVSFTGSVTNGFVSLDGTAIIPGNQSPDGCTWKTSHHIQGVIGSGMLAYSYSEMVIIIPPGVSCWQPCTEVGDVKIDWLNP